MQNEYRPFYEIEFDFTTSLSKESAVLAMLGWIGKPFREITESEYDYQWRVDCDHPITEEESLMYEPHNPSLFEILREVKDLADSEYVEAKYEEPLDENTIAEKLANIKKSHELIETAYKFYCGIDDELAKGEQSELRIDQQATINPKNSYITVMSLAKWAKKEFNIDFFPPDQLTFNDLNITQEEILESIENDSRKIDAIDLQITFALLVEDFSRCSNLFHHLHDGRPKVGPIAKEIAKQIANREDLDAQSERKITDRINDAITAKKQLSSRLSPVLYTRLQVTLGLLVQAAATYYQCPQGDPDITKIAEHLAANAIDLSDQDRLSIEARLQQALEVRKKRE
jgi:hypothetical protein